MPGSFCSCSTSRVRGSGSDKASGQAGDLQPAEESGHRLPELFIDLAASVVHGGSNQVLEHLHFVFRDDFRIDLDRLHLLGAVDDDGDHAAAGRGFDAQIAHAFLELLLHLPGLLHHFEDVHRVYISSTSRISAGNTSSKACTAGDDFASSLRSRFGADEAAAGAALAAGAASACSCFDVTWMRRPINLCATPSSHSRFESSCILATF